MRSKAIAFSIAMLMMFTSLGSTLVYANDIGTNQGKIENLKELKIVAGDEKGNLNLDKSIKRSEITKIVIYALGYEKEAKKFSNIKSKYSDVSQNHWANGVIQAATQIKMSNGKYMIEGYPDGTFKPDNNITYAELIKILVVASKKDLNDQMIKDAKWPDSYIRWAMEEKIIGKDTGVEITDYNKPAVREVAFVSLYNCKEFLKTQSKEEKKESIESQGKEKQSTSSTNRIRGLRCWDYVYSKDYDNIDSSSASKVKKPELKLAPIEPKPAPIEPKPTPVEPKPTPLEPKPQPDPQPVPTPELPGSVELGESVYIYGGIDPNINKNLEIKINQKFGENEKVKKAILDFKPKEGMEVAAWQIEKTGKVYTTEQLLNLIVTEDMLNRDEYDDYTMNLNPQLQVKGQKVDKKELEAKIESVKKLDLSGYTSDSANRLTETIKRAEKILKLDNPSITEISVELFNLEQFGKGLVSKDNKHTISFTSTESNTYTHCLYGTEDYVEKWKGASYEINDDKKSNVEYSGGPAGEYRTNHYKEMSFMSGTTLYVNSESSVYIRVALNTGDGKSLSKILIDDKPIKFEPEKDLATNILGYETKPIKIKIDKDTVIKTVYVDDQEDEVKEPVPMKVFIFSDEQENVQDEFMTDQPLSNLNESMKETLTRLANKSGFKYFYIFREPISSATRNDVTIGNLEKLLAYNLKESDEYDDEQYKGQVYIYANIDHNSVNNIPEEDESEINKEAVNVKVHIYDWNSETGKVTKHLTQDNFQRGKKYALLNKDMLEDLKSLSQTPGFKYFYIARAKTNETQEYNDILFNKTTNSYKELLDYVSKESDQYNATDFKAQIYIYASIGKSGESSDKFEDENSNPEPKLYNVETNGSIRFDGNGWIDEAVPGTKIYVEATNFGKKKYKLKVTAKSKSVEVKTDSKGKTYFIMPKSDVLIETIEVK